MIVEIRRAASSPPGLPSLLLGRLSRERALTSRSALPLGLKAAEIITPHACNILPSTSDVVAQSIVVCSDDANATRLRREVRSNTGASDGLRIWALHQQRACAVASRSHHCVQFFTDMPCPAGLLHIHVDSLTSLETGKGRFRV